MKLILNQPLIYVNGLRRSLISHVPSFSLNCRIVDNQTDYNEQVIRLRISMIPVKENLIVQLDETNESNTDIHITSSHFNNQFIMPDIFLFTLKPNQKITLECSTQMGYGYQHARWQVIQTPIMKRIDNIKLNDYDSTKVMEITPELLTNGKIDKKKCLIDKTAVFKLNEIYPVIGIEPTGEYELSFESDFYDESYCLEHAIGHLKQLFQKPFSYEIIHDPKLKILKFSESYTFANILLYYCQKHFEYATYTKCHYLNDYILFKIDGLISKLDDIRQEILVDLDKLEQSCIS